MLDWTDVYFLSEWAIRLVMLVYVPQRRTPAAARTWLLLIFILPWPGLVVYSVFGRAWLPHKRIAMLRQVSESVCLAVHERRVAKFVVWPELPTPFLQAITLAQRLGDFPIMSGNHVELLGDYDGSIERLVTDIGAATHHAHLLYYIFHDDRTGNRVADALIEARGRGVECRLLVDSLGAKPARRRLLPRLRAAGVEVHEVLPVRLLARHQPRPDLRNHRKIAVFDGKVGYIGSQNIVDADFKPGMIYEELVARLTGPIVLGLQGVFSSDLLLETGQRLEQSVYYPDPQAAGSVAAQLVPSGPGYPQANNQRMIVALIHAAQRRVVITTPYFIPDEPLLEAMQVAVMRGVELHLVVSQTVDQYLVGFAQRSYYEDLLTAGVAIHEYRPRFLHSKHLSIDGEVALIGSSNVDIRSFQLNAEISMLFYDRQVAAALRAVEDRELADSELITLEAWRHRSRRLRLLQNTARLVDSVL